MEKRKTDILRICIAALALGFFGLSTVLWINTCVISGTSDRVIQPAEAAALKDVDCILVLGCYVHERGVPSHMLEDRLKRGVELYHGGTAPKLLMTGDHGRTDYNEVETMKQYAMDAGIESSDIFMDHAGFSTYESLYRAKEIFGVDKLIIVTQEYHLYRALHIAESLGMEAYGVASDYRTYSGQTGRDIRELLARVKDVGTSVFKPLPTYLGEPIPITGDGNATNDDKSVFTYPD